MRGELWGPGPGDSCITQLKAQGPARTCNESKEEEEEEGPGLARLRNYHRLEAVSCLPWLVQESARAASSAPLTAFQRCRANLAQVKQSRPGPGLGSQIKVFKTSKVFPISLGRGGLGWWQLDGSCLELLFGVFLFHLILLV